MKLVRAFLEGMLPETCRARILPMLTARDVAAVEAAWLISGSSAMKKKVRFGSLAGLVSRVPDFLEPMSEEELRLWEGDPLDRLTAKEDKAAEFPHPAQRDGSTNTGSR
ncbi:hypothetical protein [Paracoccus benzoatiresistens]|uniref:Uncharacterized protein n=1 Tax=Paracoccus benzoatiresistens TaxID=2997341 RepID=A0ABT4J5M9_9RHOB|nr:hypothetical protein [Paracoccus sp. EF6]MCZ0962387.1 hypothetical protein [Paracoccus sp. EF6]